ncbi:CyP450 monooxygenase [Trametes meyenii]|nr:CyP450 monooxygenase [Trametes meyenii]
MDPPNGTFYFYVTLLAIFSLWPVIFYIKTILDWKKRMRGLPLPPGPPRLPIFGNLFNIPRIRPWLGFRDMRKEYGDLVYLQVLQQTMIVIGKATLATEFLEKHSANTSDRARSPVIELSGQDFNTGFMPYGQWWRRHRRVFWQHFQPNVATKYRPIQRSKVHVFLLRLLKSPSHSRRHIRNLFTSMMLKVVYDIDVTGDDDERARIIETAVDAIRVATPGKFAVEVMPVLRYVPAWFPGAGFQKQFAISKRANDELVHTLYDEVKASLLQGKQIKCVATDIIDRAERKGVSENAVDEELVSKNVCAIAFEAGADTTFSAISAALVALALHPEAQKKAQAELDSVVGPSRLPDYDDSDSLVYVNALVKETLRWHIVLPFIVPHRTIADDEFLGYFIPAGTVILPNVWEILHDPDVYESPDEFRPERFIKDGRLDTTVPDPAAFMFGFGRRICPGRYFAQASLFITLASVLHVFDIGLPLDADGKPIEIKYEQTDGMLSYPVDGRCTVTARSTAAEALIMNSQNLTDPADTQDSA